MKAIIKRGNELLFLEGASGKNLSGIEDTLILNFNEKWSYNLWYFLPKQNTLYIDTKHGDIVITFSGPISDVKFVQYEKDQIIFKIIKE